jgi:hypothetical protein
MTIPTSNSTQLSLQWRAIRFATTTLVILMASLFVVGSIFPRARPTCCVTDKGLSCSSCGITRSITSVLHGDIESSRAFHKGGVFLVALTTFFLISRPLTYLFQSPKLIAADALGFIFAWIASAIFFFGLPGSGYGGKARSEQDGAGQPATRSESK